MHRTLRLTALAAPFLAAALLTGCVSGGPGSAVSRLANRTYTADDGTELRAYLALPPGPGPFPGVLMIHEWWGLNADMTAKADSLSRLGFAVLAVDAYRGRSADTVPGAIVLVSTTPREKITADVDAGWRYLAGLPEVDPRRVGAVGFCFGGTQTMLLGTRNPLLRATVIFYGSGPITQEDKLGRLGEGGPVLGIFGEKDGNIPLEKVRAFGQAMKARGIAHRITIYPGEGHAFVKAETLDRPGASCDAWEEMAGFLAEQLRAGG
jgi:carboxymethylenebutenolidase